MTTTREPKIPGPDHPITVQPSDLHVVVRVGTQVVADTTKALTLREASYPPVQYIPLEDVDQALLTASATHTYCPYKGEASYFSIPIGGERSTNAVWTYETPFPAMAAIKNYIASTQTVSTRSDDGGGK